MYYGFILHLGLITARRAPPVVKFMGADLALTGILEKRLKNGIKKANSSFPLPTSLRLPLKNTLLERMLS